MHDPNRVYHVYIVRYWNVDIQDSEDAMVYVTPEFADKFYHQPSSVHAIEDAFFPSDIHPYSFKFKHVLTERMMLNENSAFYIGEEGDSFPMSKLKL